MDRPETLGYLYPQLRRTEVTAALFAGGYGLFALYQQSAFGIPPLDWSGLSVADRSAMAYVLTVASVAHGIGIRANGTWGRVSPSLRLIAMTIFAAIFARLAVLAPGNIGYNHTWIAAGMALGAVNALRDTIDAWQGREPRWRSH